MYNPARSTWLNPNIEYLFNEEIIEYDMRDAGFSLIKQFKLLPPDKIRELEQLPKGEERHIAVGKLQGADKNFSKALSDKFAEIRTIFINSNSLTDDRLVSVKKDAIFTIGQCDHLKFGVIHFIPKHTYSSYVRFPNIQNLEIYYVPGKIDIKGMGEIAINRHRLYMIQFLIKIIGMIEGKQRGSKRMVMKFIDDYKAQVLDEGYYLEFNNMSREMNPSFNYQNLIIPLVQIINREID